MKKLAIGLLLSMVSVSAFANTPNFKTLADEKATFELCKKYAETFNKDLPNIDSAIDIIRPYSLNNQTDLDSLSYNGKLQLTSLSDILGNPIDVVHFDTIKYAQNTLINHTFLLKRTKYPMYVECGFYRPTDKWQLYHFKWSSQIIDIQKTLL